MESNAAFHTIDDFDMRGKRVLLRVDLNVPMQDGVVVDTLRIERVLPTVRALSKRGAKVILLSHLGRPKGRVVPELSLRAVVAPLEEALNQRIAFGEDCVGSGAANIVAKLEDGEVALLENLRFHAGEETNDEAFASALADLGDLYVNDAFSCSHRAHASVERLAKKLPSAAGPVLKHELATLKQMLENPARPVFAIVGGAKISTKLDILNHLMRKNGFARNRGSNGKHIPAGQGIRGRHVACRNDHGRGKRKRPSPRRRKRNAGFFFRKTLSLPPSFVKTFLPKRFRSRPFRRIE